MAFRKKQGDWEQFVREHAEELSACGVAANIYRNRQRFFLFLQEGWDESGWFNQECLFSNVTILRTEQARSFADFIRRQFAADFSGFADALDRHAAALDYASQINSTVEVKRCEEERRKPP